MVDNDVEQAWKTHWKNEKSVESVASPVGTYLRHRRLGILRKIIRPLEKTLSVIDMGCGTGDTLLIFREEKFQRSIGIDYVPQSLTRCEGLGFIIDQDVFLMDAGETMFIDQQFDIVFSEGMWEHFVDPERYIKEATRISKQYVIVVQPNHFSLFGRLMLIGWNLFSRKGVAEYSFKMSYFIEKLDKYGFYLMRQHSTILKEQMILVFHRK